MLMPYLFLPLIPDMDKMDKEECEKKLYTRLRLWQFSDKYIIEPIDGASDSYLSISRFDGSICLIGLLTLVFAVVIILLNSLFSILNIVQNRTGMDLQLPFYDPFYFTVCLHVYARVYSLAVVENCTV